MILGILLFLKLSTIRSGFSNSYYMLRKIWDHIDRTIMGISEHTLALLLIGLVFGICVVICVFTFLSYR